MKKGPSSTLPFQLLIIARNLLSGDLLASALEKEKICRASAVKASDAIRTLAKEPIGVMVIASDLNSDSHGGFDLAREVSTAHPDVKIVIVTDHTTQSTVINAFRAGASGIISREQPLTDFFDCIAQVSKGHLWSGPKETSYVLDVLRSIPAVNPAASMDSSLTMREMQVVRSAAAGRTNKEIAVELGLSEHTVKNYLFKAFEKLGVSSRVELLFSLTLGGQARDQGRAAPQEH